MASNPFGSLPGMNPFTSFWTDFFSKMVAAGITPATPPADMAEQLRRSFFDSMSKYCDEFMRSEAFLQAMKQSMDNALAWQASMNQYLQKGLQAAQMPSRADSEQLVAMVRGLEDRLFSRLDSLAERIEKLEKAASRGEKTERTRSKS